MRVGQRVIFTMYDNLFKDIIAASGVLIRNIYGKLWRIQPDKRDRLSGRVVQVHEDCINE